MLYGLAKSVAGLLCGGSEAEGSLVVGGPGLVPALQLEGTMAP